MGLLPPEPSSDDPGQPVEAVLVCAVTGVTIPECSCANCITEQIRLHAPALLALTPLDPPRAA